jgi:hypothetical protein
MFLAKSVFYLRTSRMVQKATNWKWFEFAAFYYSRQISEPTFFDENNSKIPLNRASEPKLPNTQSIHKGNLRIRAYFHSVSEF